MRATMLLALALSGCVWQAEGDPAQGSTSDEEVTAPCVVTPPNIVGVARYDFGADAAGAAFKARVMAFATGGTGSVAVTWDNSGTVASASCGSGQDVVFVVLP